MNETQEPQAPTAPAPQPPPMVTLNQTERSRTYIFASGNNVTLNNVVKVGVSTSTHRIETADGKKYIIPLSNPVNPVLTIALDVDEWTF